MSFACSRPTARSPTRTDPSWPPVTAVVPPTCTELGCQACVGLTRPVLAGLVGMSASWPNSIERDTLLSPRPPLPVKLEAVAVNDVAALVDIDMDLGGATWVPARRSLASLTTRCPRPRSASNVSRRKKPAIN